MTVTLIQCFGGGGCAVSVQGSPGTARHQPERLDFGEATFDNFIVFVRIGKFLVIAMLVATTGAHWMLLQSVAWTVMLADNLHSTSLPDALVKTFDGKHPCCLCKAIAAGKKSEQKREFTAQTQKLEFPPFRESVFLLAPSQFRFVRTANTFAEAFTQEPPTPPPREFFV